MASLPCPHCNKPVNVPDGMGGKQMRCPSCRKVFPIPAEPAAVKAAAAPALVPPAPQPAAAAIPALVPPAAKPANKAAVKASGPSAQGIALMQPASAVRPGNAKPVLPGPPLVPRPSHQAVPKPAPAPAPAATVPAAYPHIEKLPGQPARLQRVPGIRIAQVVMDYLAFGWSPEEMCRQHPHLAPADVHVAMAYYYENRGEIEQEIVNELNQVTQDQARAHPSPALLRMRSG